MAKVSLDLAELKEYEDKIKSLEGEVEEYKENQFKVAVSTTSFKREYTVDIEKARDYLLRDHSFGWSRHNIRTLDDLVLYEVLSPGVRTVIKETKEYTGLDSIKEQIREEEANKVEERMIQLVKEANNVKDKLTRAEDNYESNLTGMKKDYKSALEAVEIIHNKEIAELTRVYQDKKEARLAAYLKLEEEFKDFKENKKRVSLEEQVDSLTKALEVEKQKSFWAKLLNRG